MLIVAMLGLQLSTAEIALILTGVFGCVTAYNTWTGHRALRWQQRRDQERRERRVEIHFEHASMTEEAGDEATVMLGGRQNLPLYYRLRIVVVNRSETSPVWVRRVTIERAEGDVGYDLTNEEDPGAFRLEPGEPWVRDVAIDRLGPDFSKGVVAKTHLAPDDWVESEAEELMEELLLDIRRRNSGGDGGPAIFVSE